MHNIANNKSSKLTSAILYNTHLSLENMGLIKKVKKGKYELVDIFLNIILKQNDDEMLALENILKLDI